MCFFFLFGKHNTGEGQVKFKNVLQGKYSFLSEHGQLSGGGESRDVTPITWWSLTITSLEVGVIKFSLFPAGEAHKDYTSFSFRLCFVRYFSCYSEKLNILLLVKYPAFCFLINLGYL